MDWRPRWWRSVISSSLREKLKWPFLGVNISYVIYKAEARAQSAEQLMRAVKFGVGQSVVRKEDDPLLRGRGRYIGDSAPRGTLCAVVLRSPHAHARFRIDTTKARAVPGVRLVLTGVETADLGPLPCAVELPDTVLKVPPYPVLVREEVRHVGDALAFVVADTIERAKDGAEAIIVAWEE